MDDLGFGRILRTLRVRRLLRQSDLARLAGVSESSISRLERGHLGTLSLATIRRVSAALEVRAELLPRWRGGELDRLLAARHASLAGSVTERLEAAGWLVRPEVTFSIYGERGAVDLLAWHPGAASSPSTGPATAYVRGPRPCLLVIELKTEIVDVGELLATLHRKVRLAPQIARDTGLGSGAVSSCLIVAEGRTNRRRVQANAALLRSALPHDGRRFGRWVAAPAGSVSAVVFWPDLHPGVLRQRRAPTQRVRRPNPHAETG